MLHSSDLPVKKDFVALKAKVDKLNIDKLTNVPTSSYSLKTKVDGLDIGKLKTPPVDFEKIKEVVKNTKFNTLKTKLNNLEKKIPDAITLIHIN